MKIRLSKPSCVLAALLLFLSASSWAADSWIEIKSPHFTVATNSGERQGRHMAHEFEEIREAFHVFFPKLQTDSGAPLRILAVRDENSMKLVLPEFWATKGHMHPAGVFQRGWDENFAVIQTDELGQADNPYETLYHEYAHSVFHLNFDDLPVWLDEGLAEFYSQTKVTDKETQVGHVARWQLEMLQEPHMLPLDQVLTAGHDSPLYNEENRTGNFYAESWVLVHYLMFSPDAQKQHYFSNYLQAWQETHDLAESARRGFGDLNKLTQSIRLYSGRLAFSFYRIKSEGHVPAEKYEAHPMTPAQALVAEADVLLHTDRLPEAHKLLAQAADLDPNLATLHTALGYEAYRKANDDEAQKEFEQAIKLDPKDFRPYFFMAHIAERHGKLDEQSAPDVVAKLEKAIQLNPNFAPAYLLLSHAYLNQPEDRQKALDAAIKADNLQPSIDAMSAVGYALISLDRESDARIIADKLKKGARTPQEKLTADSYAMQLDRYFQRRHENPAAERVVEESAQDADAQKK